MKKLFATLAVAGLTTVAAFAQTPAPTVTFGGYFNTGAVGLANGTDKAIAGLYGQDAGKLGGRFNLDGKFITAEGLSGATFQIRSENWGGATNGGSTAFVASTFLKSAYVWSNYFDKLLYAQVGIINEQSARSTGDMAQSYTKEIPGFVVNVLPLEGLVIQGAVSLPVTGTGQVSNVADLTTVLGGVYTVPATVKFQAQAKFAPTETNQSGTNSGKPAPGSPYGVSAVLANVSLLAVPNLKFVLETEFSKLGDTVNKSKSIFSETIDYGFKDMGAEAFHAGLIAYQFVNGSDLLTNGTDKQGLGLKFNPWVSYKLDGGITPKLGLTYFSGPELAENDASYTYNTYALRSSSSGTAYQFGAAPVTTGTDLNKVAILEIRPAVKVDFSATQSVTFSYAYTMSIGSDDVTFLSTDSKATNMQTLQAEYLYKF